MSRIGHASLDENRNTKGGKAGDQTGREVCTTSWYKKSWSYVLRAKDKDIAEKMAIACEKGCANSHLGYDQGQRNTLRTQAKLVGMDLSRITTDCECDCSSFMTACAECAGIKIVYPSGNAPVTANMVKWFSQTGMFEIITGEINNPAYLLRGDILVGAPNTHTVMVLDNGMNVIQKRKTLRRGAKGEEVKYLQSILQKLGYNIGKFGVDGDFGKDTASAVKQFQIDHGLVADSIVGIKTWAMLEKYD